MTYDHLKEQLNNLTEASLMHTEALSALHQAPGELAHVTSELELAAAGADAHAEGLRTLLAHLQEEGLDPIG